jgi:hypothetical protein
MARFEQTVNRSYCLPFRKNEPTRPNANAIQIGVKNQNSQPFREHFWWYYFENPMGKKARA